MNRKGAWLLAVLLAVLCGIPARAAELEPAYVRTVFDQTNGLPTDEANAVLQTREGYLWVGSYGGLLRFDLSEKPIMKTLRSLIKETWHTALSGNTEGSNQATVKGFHGLYELVAHHDGRETVTEFHLDRRIDLDHKIVLR